MMQVTVQTENAGTRKMMQEMTQTETAGTVESQRRKTWMKGTVELVEFVKGFFGRT
jgi:hypothetical protein